MRPRPRPRKTDAWQDSTDGNHVGFNEAAAAAAENAGRPVRRRPAARSFNEAAAAAAENADGRAEKLSRVFGFNEAAAAAAENVGLRALGALGGKMLQ